MQNKQDLPRLVIRVSQDEFKAMKLALADRETNFQEVGYQLLIEWLEGKKKLTKRHELSGDLRRKIGAFRGTLEEMLDAIDDITRPNDPDVEEERGKVLVPGGFAPGKVGGTGKGGGKGRR